MYCTTNPKQIEAEVKTARRIIAKYTEPNPRPQTMAERDALSAAVATVALYADLLDENDHVAEYRSL